MEPWSAPNDKLGKGLVMPTRKIIIDANVIDQVLRGNAQAAELLNTLLKSPDIDASLARKAFTELNSDVERQFLKEIGLKPALTSTLLDERFPDYEKFSKNINTKDVTIAVEAKVRDAELFTMDKKFRDSFAQVGGKVTPESKTLTGVGTPRNVTLARQLMQPKAAPPVAAANTALWFRGEAVGVAPAKPGGTPPHDLSEGLYLTDNKASALQYAELRTADPAARRVFSVKIDLSSLRVLDLRTDPRWQKDLKMLEPSLQGANENYGRAFDNFIRANKIDLREYDVVIARDYVRGGHQMCVLHQDGAPTALQQKIRGAFVPETTPHGPGASTAYRGPRTVGGKIGGGLRFIGGTALMLGLMVLGQWLRVKAEERWFKRRMAELEPEIVSKVREHVAAIASLQAEGKKAFANVTIKSVRTNVTSLGRELTVDGFPFLSVQFVGISPDDVNLEGRTEHQWILSDERVVSYFTYSFEVSVSEEEVSLFRALMTEYQFYESMKNHNPAGFLKMGLHEAQVKAREKVIKAFGPAVEFDVLDAWMWPKFKYQGKKL